MWFPYLITPMFPTNCDEPPTLYALMNSICNFGKEDKTNIYNLAKGARTTIFDFTYPLSSHVNKEDFEIMILNHYIMRRIGFETPTAFKIALNVKMNEIMPKYNKILDALDGWNIFNDGESIARTTTDNGSNTINSSSNVSNTNISDRRNSEMPQNQITDIQDGDYMTDYNYDTTTDSGTTQSSSVGSNTNTTSEVINRSPADKIKIYKEFMQNVESVYTLIFKELDSLFYGLV